MTLKGYKRHDDVGEGDAKIKEEFDDEEKPSVLNECKSENEVERQEVSDRVFALAKGAISGRLNCLNGAGVEFVPIKEEVLSDEDETEDGEDYEGATIIAIQLPKSRNGLPILKRHLHSVGGAVR